MINKPLRIEDIKTLKTGDIILHNSSSRKLFAFIILEKHSSINFLVYDICINQSFLINLKESVRHYNFRLYKK